MRMTTFRHAGSDETESSQGKSRGIMRGYKADFIGEGEQSSVGFWIRSLPAGGGCVEAAEGEGAEVDGLTRAIKGKGRRGFLGLKSRYTVYVGNRKRNGCWVNG